MASLGEDVRGNMMNVFDSSRNQRAADEEIVRKGKMETQQGMSALRGKAAGNPSAGSHVPKGNDSNTATGVTSARYSGLSINPKNWYDSSLTPGMSSQTSIQRELVITAMTQPTYMLRRMRIFLNVNRTP
ncbi:hypothetical protein C0992_007922 [Termitomyces sp. T32_za158]|nr:hypothetical protein C0992_007922 [Termitomyces sp. T32_za158]